jgi:isocitrate/isopropylmalate dehydrogenase
MDEQPIIMAAAMAHTITLITGAGIGPEVTRAVLRVLADDRSRTRDLGGSATATSFTDALCAAL